MSNSVILTSQDYHILYVNETYRSPRNKLKQSQTLVNPAFHKPKFLHSQGTLINATAPFQKLNIDFKGSLPHSKKGNRLLLKLILTLVFRSHTPAKTPKVQLSINVSTTSSQCLACQKWFTMTEEQIFYPRKLNRTCWANQLLLQKLVATIRKVMVKLRDLTGHYGKLSKLPYILAT